jgi:hypothetical protein
LLNIEIDGFQFHKLSDDVGLKRRRLKPVHLGERLKLGLTHLLETLLDTLGLLGHSLKSFVKGRNRLLFNDGLLDSDFLGSSTAGSSITGAVSMTGAAASERTTPIILSWSSVTLLPICAERLPRTSSMTR